MAADLGQLERALVNADSAGDTEAARALAQEIKRVRGQQKQFVRPEAEPQPSMFRNAMDMTGEAMSYAPWNIAAERTRKAVSNINEFVEGQAYKAGGSMTDLASKYMSPESAAKVGFATNVGIQAIPTVLGGELAKLAGSPVLKAAGRRVMHSAMKPPSSSMVGANPEGRRAIETMLKEGYNVTPGSAIKMREAITKLKNKVTSIIAPSKEVVDKKKVIEELNEVMDRVSKQGTPEASIKAVQNAIDEFSRYHPDKIPVPLANEIKSATQKMVSDDYGQLSGAATEAQKAIARGLRKGIDEIYPDAAKLNAKEHELLNALYYAEGRAAMSGNANLGGLSFLASNPAAAAAFLADRSSLFKSLVGRMLYSGSRNIPGALGAGGAAAYEASTQNP